MKSASSRAGRHAGLADCLCVTRTAAARGSFLLCRYLVEAPPNICTPTHIAKAAQAIAESAPDVMSLEVLEKADCEAMGMGCFLGVAECSAEPLKFVHLTYKPKGGVRYLPLSLSPELQDTAECLFGYKACSVFCAHRGFLRNLSSLVLAWQVLRIMSFWLDTLPGNQKGRSQA